MKSDIELHQETKLFGPETIDFSQYFVTITRNFWPILAFTIGSTLIAVVVAFSITPLYTAKTSILIEVDTTNISPVQELYGLDSSRKEYFETQYVILRSRQIAERAVARLELYENEYFNRDVIEANKGFITRFVDGTKRTLKNTLLPYRQKKTSPLSEEQKLAANIRFSANLLMTRINVQPIKNTQSVDIYVETEDPQLSARVANTIADVYIENYLEAKLEMTEKATGWLNTSIQELRDKLTEAEQGLETFDENNEVVNIDGVVGLMSERVQQLSDEFLTAQLSLQRDQALYEKISTPNTKMDDISTLPEVLNHPSMQNIKIEEIATLSKVSELQQIYGPKHPTLIAAKAELSSIRQSMSDQIRNLISSITTQYRETLRNVNAIERDLNSAKAELRKLSSLGNERRTLERDVSINQQLYDSFFMRLNETAQVGGFESANARILDEARAPNMPSSPNTKLIIVAALALSLGLGCMTTILLEAFNNRVRSVEDVEFKLFQKMLGIVPKVKRKRNENLPLQQFFDPEQFAFSESIRTLRTSIQLLDVDSMAKSILVTSSVPKEGKSTVSVNLALALGQLNKVLLVDTDLRRPSIADLFSLPKYQPGLANVIAGTHDLKACLVEDKKYNVDVLPAGSLPPNPQELLASKSFGKLMEELHSMYDHIIVDSAPIQAVSDAIIVSKYCDSLIYVVKADSTSQKLINKGLSRFIAIGRRIDGVVLSQVDLAKAKKTDEYSGYYDQYGYSNFEDAEKAG